MVSHTGKDYGPKWCYLSRKYNYDTSVDVDLIAGKDYMPNNSGVHYLSPKQDPRILKDMAA